MGLNNIAQCSKFLDQHLFHPCYENLSQVAQDSSIVFFASSVIGATDGIASVVQTIGGVATAAIKGAGNLAK